jgi:hypothetical protein
MRRHHAPVTVRRTLLDSLAASITGPVVAAVSAQLRSYHLKVGEFRGHLQRLEHRLPHAVMARPQRQARVCKVPGPPPGSPVTSKSQPRAGLRSQPVAGAGLMR